MEALNTVRVIQKQSTTALRYPSAMNPFNADLSNSPTYATLETGLLKDVTDDYYYGCDCQSCSHTARLSLVKLRSRLGDDYPLKTIRGRLKCQQCKSRKVIITFLGPHQKRGSLQPLFDMKPV
jgi:hypothetical protein